MKWRKISEADVQAAVTNPDYVEFSIKGRKNVFKTLGGRLLKITCILEGNEIVVVTAMVKGR